MQHQIVWLGLAGLGQVQIFLDHRLIMLAVAAVALLAPEELQERPVMAGAREITMAGRGQEV
jgi:hypothetical protein